MKRPSSLMLSVVWKLWQITLAFFPQSFRHQYGEELRTTTQELLRDALYQGGPRGLIATSLCVFADMAWRLVPEHRWAHRASVQLVQQRPGEHFMSILQKDLSYALRHLRRKPTFALVVVETLALVSCRKGCLKESGSGWAGLGVL